MDIVKLVELVDENLNIKPTFFELKEFYKFSSNSVLYYYSFNQDQVNLGENFKYFLNPKKGDEKIFMDSPSFHMNSFNYYALIVEEMINNLNKDQSKNFKNFKNLQESYSFFEYESKYLFGKRNINGEDYSGSENEILMKYNSCKKFILSMAIIHQNFLKTKIYSKYFEEVEDEINSLKKVGNKIRNINKCNNYLLKLYGLENFILK